MESLLDLAVRAHGGLDRWNQFNTISLHMNVSGVLWAAKGQDGIINDSNFTASLREQKTSYIDFEKPGQQANFQPDKVSIIDNGELIDELKDPRASFNDHKFETQWSKLQLVYFGSYAMWEYLTIPFIFTLPGFITKEIEPWHEAGETWRRLHVTFPEGYAYHSREQVFYFDQNGFIKRIDYQVDVSEDASAAHYIFDYKEFQGIMVPTRREVYPRDADGNYIKEPLLVKNVVDNVLFS